MMYTLGTVVLKGSFFEMMLQWLSLKAEFAALGCQVVNNLAVTVPGACPLEPAARIRKKIFILAA